MAQMIILDTDVLIDYFRGLPDAKSYIGKIPLTQRVTTDVTLMELFQGAQNKGEPLMP